MTCAPAGAATFSAARPSAEVVRNDAGELHAIVRRQGSAKDRQEILFKFGDAVVASHSGFSRCDEHCSKCNIL